MMVYRESLQQTCLLASCVFYPIAHCSLSERKSVTENDRKLHTNHCTQEVYYVVHLNRILPITFLDNIYTKQFCKCVCDDVAALRRL